VQRPAADQRPRRHRALAHTGAIRVAIATTGAGALPTDPYTIWTAVRDVHAAPLVAFATMACYLGLTLLVGAWLRIGSLLRERQVPVRQLTETLIWWALPFVLAPPLYSRDVYSYVAQGMMVNADIDPYRNGPAAIGGELASNVSPIWQYAAAPYGPTFLAAAAFVTFFTGGSIVGGILGMRLVMVASVVVLAKTVPALAERYNVNPSTALWLGVLNPLVLAHLVSGIHNDALMMALLLAGMVLATKRRPMVAAVVIALAALVKAPAGVAILFIAPAMARELQARYPGTRFALAKGLAIVSGVAVGTAVVFTAAMGTWYGWVGALRGTAKARNGLSLSTDLGWLLDQTMKALGLAAPIDPITVVRGVGMLAALGVLGWVLLRFRGRPMFGLGIVLAAVVLLGPAVHPWYLLWGIITLAAATRDRRIIKAIVVVSALMAFYPMPAGGGPTASAVFGGLGVLTGWLYLRLNPVTDEIWVAATVRGLPEEPEEPRRSVLDRFSLPLRADRSAQARETAGSR
jgi:alpha-1,6-mannosyltransferase